MELMKAANKDEKRGGERQRKGERCRVRQNRMAISQSNSNRMII